MGRLLELGKRERKRHKLFMTRSIQAMNNLKNRCSKKAYPLPEFSLDELREKIKAALDAGVCKYSPLDPEHYAFHKITPKDFSADHAIPVDRGGSSKFLSNVDIICGGCNKAKGNMSDTEFEIFLSVVRGFGSNVEESRAVHASVIGRLKAGAGIWNRAAFRKK